MAIRHAIYLYILRHAAPAVREVAEHDARCARREGLRPLDGLRSLGRLPLAQPPLGAHL